MSLYGSLFSAVSGLNAQSVSVSINSDNISNINTGGYKASRVCFSTLVTSAPSNKYSSGGVTATSRQTLDSQGLIQGTGESSDIAISGNGFFVVNTNSDGSGTFLYTRAGSFRNDQYGNYVNTAGYTLMGWPLDNSGNLPGANGNIDTTSSSLLASLKPVNIKTVSGTANATTSVTIGANLRESQDILKGTGETINFPSTDTINYKIAASDIIGFENNPSANNIFNYGDSISLTPSTPGTTYTFTYGGFWMSKDITSSILGASTVTDNFTAASQGWQFSITYKGNTTNLTYTPNSPNSAAGQFNSIESLAAAINSIEGFKARVDTLGKSIYFGPEDATKEWSMKDITGTFVQNLFGGSSATDGASINIPAQPNRFSSLQGLANLINSSSGIGAIVNSPLESSSLKFYSTNPLGTLTISATDISAATVKANNANVALSLTRGQLTGYVNTLIANALTVLQNASASNINMLNKKNSFIAAQSTLADYTIASTPISNVITDVEANLLSASTAYATLQDLNNQNQLATSARKALYVAQIILDANSTNSVLTASTEAAWAALSTYDSNNSQANLTALNTAVAQAISDAKNLLLANSSSKPTLEKAYGDSVSNTITTATSISNNYPMAPGSADLSSALVDAQSGFTLYTTDVAASVAASYVLSNVFVKNNIGTLVSTQPGLGVSTPASILNTLGLSSFNTNGVSDTPPKILSPAYDPTGTNAPNMSSGTIATQFSINVQVFDGFGTPHNLNIGFVKTAINNWNVEIYINPPSDIVSSRTDGQVGYGIVSFNGDGSLRTVSAGLSSPISISWANQAIPSSISFNWGTAGEVSGTVGATSIGQRDGLGQLDSISETNFANQNGISPGLLNSITYDEKGFVIANFTNGTSKKIFQLPVASFANPNGLKNSGGNGYAQTTNSGSYILHMAGSGTAGQIAPSALEQANVELSDELTNMIVAQRGYQANSQVIKIVNSMLEDLNRALM